MEEAGFFTCNYKAVVTVAIELGIGEPAFFGGFFKLLSNVSLIKKG